MIMELGISINIKFYDLYVTMYDNKKIAKILACCNMALLWSKRNMYSHICILLNCVYSINESIVFFL